MLSTSNYANDMNLIIYPFLFMTTVHEDEWCTRFFSWNLITRIFYASTRVRFLHLYFAVQIFDKTITVTKTIIKCIFCILIRSVKLIDTLWHHFILFLHHNFLASSSFIGTKAAYSLSLFDIASFSKIC